MPSRVVLAGVAAACAAVGTPLGLVLTRGHAAPKSAPTAKTFLQLTNQYRVNHHLGRLSVNSQVQAAALANTKYMVKTKKLRTDPAVQNHFGTKCSQAGSLAAEGQPNAQAIMKLLESNRHTRQILLGPYTQAGIAPVTSRGLTWVTFDFVGGC